MTLAAQPVHIVSKHDDHNNSDEFERADMNKAFEHWNRYSLRKFDPNGGLLKPLNKNFHRKELGKYSTGFQLYFKFLKWLMVLFGIVCIPGAYLMYFNYMGKGYTQIRSPFDSLTLGNMPDYSNITTVLTTQGFAAWQEEISKIDKELMIQQYVDLAISYLLFFFMLMYRVSSSREKDEIDINNCSPSDYAIEVNGIPSKGVTEMEVATHFGMLYGSVNQCKFAYNYEGTMPYFINIAELISAKRRQEAKIQFGLSKNIKRVTYYERRIQELKKRVAKTLKARFGEEIMTHSDYPAIKAFVIFDTLKSQHQALREYEKYQSVSFYKTLFCCLRNSRPQRLKLLGKYKVTIKQADEPSNIKWENQDTGTFEAIARFFVVYLVVIACLVFTFGFIIASNVLSYSAQLGAACNAGGTSETSFQIFSSSSAVNCYCAGLPLTEILETASIRETCSSYLKARSLQIGMTIASGVCIAIINAIIKQIFIGLARFQRYDTLSRESGATLIKYFFSLFINTAVIPILANSDIYGLELSKKIVQLFIHDASGLLDSTYPTDFNSNWYSQVGSKIMSPMIIAIFSPHLIALLMIPCKKRRIKRRAKRMVFQKDLNKLFTPPEFKISFSYAMALNILFVSFAFSSGMPLLYGSGFLSLVVIYYSDKYKVARFCRKPPGYDSAMNDLVIKSIPFSLLIHCLMAVWMYGCSAIFPYDPSSITWGHVPSDGNYGPLNRVQRSLPHAVLAALSLVTIFIDFFLSPLFSAFSNQAEKDFQAKLERKKFGTFRHEYHKLTQVGVASYNMKANPDYHEVMDAMHLEVEDDDDLSESGDEQDNSQNQTVHNMTTQRLMQPNNPSRSPETDISVTFSGGIQPAMMLGTSPVLGASPMLNPRASIHTQEPKGEVLLVKLEGEGQTQQPKGEVSLLKLEGGGQ